MRGEWGSRQTMNRYGFEPDFDNLKTVLKGSRGHRVPNAELVIDREIKETFLGRSVESIPHEIESLYLEYGKRAVMMLEGLV